MATETDELAAKLEKYVLQLRQVEAALKVDPAHVELLKIKGDLNELIDITKNLLTGKVDEGAPAAKKPKLSPESIPSKKCSETAAVAGTSNTPEHAVTSAAATMAKIVPSALKSEDTDVMSSINVQDTTPNSSKTSKEQDTTPSESSSESEVESCHESASLQSTTVASSSNINTSPTSENSANTSADQDNECTTIVAYDKDGNRFTLADYHNYKVTDKTLKNYFAKHKKKLNQMCINDHREMHGLSPIKFRRNRGLGSKRKYEVYKDKSGSGSND